MRMMLLARDQADSYTLHFRRIDGGKTIFLCTLAVQKKLWQGKKEQASKRACSSQSNPRPSVVRVKSLTKIGKRAGPRTSVLVPSERAKVVLVRTYTPLRQHCHHQKKSNTKAKTESGCRVPEPSTRRKVDNCKLMSTFHSFLVRKPLIRTSDPSIPPTSPTPPSKQRRAQVTISQERARRTQIAKVLAFNPREP